jgi:hypothetical protein
MWMRRFWPLGGWATGDIRAAYPRAAAQIQAMGMRRASVHEGVSALCKHLRISPPRPNESALPYLDRCERLLTRNAESG